MQSTDHVALIRCDVGSCLAFTCANSLSFSCNDNNILIQFNAIFIPQNTWQHDLSTIADSIHLKEKEHESKFIKVVQTQ